MKKKLGYSILIIVCIVDLIITVAVGLNVSLYYGEGYTLTFSESSININDIKPIAKEVFGDKFVVQEVEFFNDSCMIKVKEVNDDELQSLCDKLNEKYSSELQTSDISVNHVSNVRIRNIVKPYIIPMILSTLIVLFYYAIRFKGAKQMIGLLKNLVIIGVIFYSILAIGRVKVDFATMPLALVIYILTIFIYTVYAEKQKDEE